MVDTPVSTKQISRRRRWEPKWGAGRLRLLVTPELREKFNRQRCLFNAAIWQVDLEAMRRKADRMVTAWLALDRAATAARRQPSLRMSGR